MKRRNNDYHHMPYGYPVASGYMGWVANRFMLFVTEKEYLEWLDWYEAEAEGD